MKRVLLILLSILIILSLLGGIGYILYTNNKQAALQQEQEGKIAEGTGLLKEGKALEAYQCFQSLANQNADSTEIRYGLFLSAYEIRYYSKAASCFGGLPGELRAQLSDRTYADMIAWAHQSGQSAEAQSWLQEGLSHHPDSEALKQLQEGKFPELHEQVPLLSGGAKSDAQSSEAEAEKRQVRAWMDAGNYSEAAPVLQRHIESKPDDAEAWKNLATCYVNLDQADRYRALTQAADSHKVDRSSWPSFYGTTTGNMQNGGEMVRLGDYLYFPRYSTYYLSRWKLDLLDRTPDDWRAGKVQPEEVLKEGVAYLNARDDILYFSNQSKKGALVAYRPSDGAQRVLYDHPVDQVLLAGPYIYFRDLTNEEKQLKRLRLDHPEEVQTLVTSLVRSYTMDAHSIYFINQSDQNKIYRLPLDASSEPTRILDYRADELVTNDNHLVFVNTLDDQRIWTSDTSGQTPRRLLDAANCSHLNLADDGMLYYNNWTLQSLNLKNGAVDTLSEFSADKITVLWDKKHGDTVFFANENYNFYKCITRAEWGWSFQIDP